MEWPKYLALGGANGSSVQFDRTNGVTAIYYRPAGAWKCLVRRNEKGLEAFVLYPGEKPKKDGFVPCVEVAEDYFKNDNRGYV